MFNIIEKNKYKKYSILNIYFFKKEKEYFKFWKKIYLFINK